MLKKTQAIIFSKKPDPNFPLTINDVQVIPSDNINFLGITFDKKLNFKCHIDKIRTKIARSLGFLYRHKNFIPLSNRLQLYYSFIYPHLTNGIELWGTGPQSNLKPLLSLQKRAIRFITNTPYRTPSGPLYKRLRILNITQIYNRSICLLMYKAFQQKLPPKIQTLFQRTAHRQTRAAPWNFKLGCKGSKIKNACPSIAGPFIWNSLPDCTKSATTIQTFKRKLKMNLFPP